MPVSAEEQRLLNEASELKAAFRRLTTSVTPTTLGAKGQNKRSAKFTPQWTPASAQHSQEARGLGGPVSSGACWKCGSGLYSTGSCSNINCSTNDY